MKHSIGLFAPPEVMRRRVFNHTAFHESEHFTSAGRILVVVAIALAIANVVYIGGLIPEYEGGPPLGWEFSFKNFLLINAALILFPIANIGWRTHFLREKATHIRGTLALFESMPVEYQAEFGGRDGFLEQIKYCDERECEKIAAGIHDILQSVEEQKEIERIAKSQGKDVLNKVASIRRECREINHEFRRVLHGE